MYIVILYIVHLYDVYCLLYQSMYTGINDKVRKTKRKNKMKQTL